MSVSNGQIEKPDTGPDYLPCLECDTETFVDDMTEQVCDDCRPCGECEGEGCDECIEEVPKLPRAGIEVAMDKLAGALAILPVSTTKHLFRETIAAHMDPEIQKLKDVIVGLVTISTHAVAEYAIAVKDKIGQDEISELKNTIAGMAANQAYLFSSFLGHLGWEAEQKKLRESNAHLLKAAEKIVEMVDRFEVVTLVQGQDIVGQFRTAIEAAKDRE